MKKKKFDIVKASSNARRIAEIEKYGKLISRRPSSVHKSKKAYNRQDNKKIEF